MNDLTQDNRITDCLHWRPKDFALLQSRITTSESRAAELQIRENNLRLIAGCFEQHGIPCWLQGKTLQGVIQEGCLPVDDHDDDLGTPAEFYGTFCQQLYPDLKPHGFQVIRQEPDMISLLRDGRYVDICFFSERNGLSGYGSKWFPVAHFQKLENIEFAGNVFKVPTNAETLLTVMYPPERQVLARSRDQRRRGPLKKIKRKIKNLRRRMKELLLTKTVVRPLSYEEFLALKIEADNSINWVLRQPHLDILTDGGRWRTVGSIIDYLKGEDRLAQIRQHGVVETPTAKPFAEPLNLNEIFWKKGNNFFFYCVFYGFRMGVIPYERANQYIGEGRQPMLYSASYYEALKIMSEDDIRALLAQAPLLCEAGAVVHGKHRVCAMMGRILSGQAYLPFQIKEQVRRF